MMDAAALALPAYVMAVLARPAQAGCWLVIKLTGRGQ